MAGKPRSATPELDFSGIVATKAAAPRRVSGVSGPNPALAWLRESWDARKVSSNRGGVINYLGEGRQVTVPTVNAKQVVSLIRRAAEQLGAETDTRIGATIKVEDNPKDSNGKVLRGQSIVSFAAKTGKKEYTKSGAAGKAGATPAAPNADKKSV